MSALRRKPRRLRPSDFYTGPLPPAERKAALRATAAAMITADVECFRFTGNGWWMWRAIGTWAGLGRTCGVEPSPELAAYLQRAALAVADPDGTTSGSVEALGLAKQSGGAHAAFRAEQQRQMFEKFGAFNRAVAAGMSESEALAAVAPQFDMTKKALALLVRKMRARAAEQR